MYQQVTLIINATINKNTPQGPKKKRRQCADVFEKKGLSMLSPVIHSAGLTYPRQLLEIVWKSFSGTFWIKNRHSRI